MYFEILRGILFEHASIYRAVTVEEYRGRFVSRAAHEAEYAKLCEHWTRALRKVDPYLMTVTVEIYDLLEIMGIAAADYSEWEITGEIEDGNNPDRLSTPRRS